ncbi:sigma-70 family RNA polymerase sigma factor [Streptomyces misionensis]|uniref:sigma-70 family RNA polymerase sigma factor n=1 Tax=Streptomyces misionensis TaxID=67331 RepID=UPI0036F858DA
MTEPGCTDGVQAPHPATLQGTGDSAADTRQLVNEEFSAFYRATLRPLVQFLINQGTSVYLAADIAQDTMTKAYRRWTEIDQPRAWAHRVASRALVRHLSRVMEDPTDTIPEPTSLMPRPDAALEWEARQSTLAVLQALPPRQRQVLAWTLNGHTPAEIAAELSMTPEAVRSSLKKGRRAATQHLHQSGEQP